jgi:cation transporter-like permease
MLRSRAQSPGPAEAQHNAGNASRQGGQITEFVVFITFLARRQFGSAVLSPNDSLAHLQLLNWPAGAIALSISQEPGMVQQTRIAALVFIVVVELVGLALVFGKDRVEEPPDENSS